MRTDWNKVAGWYGDYLGQRGTYQTDLIFPGVKRRLQPRAGRQYVDIACGEGTFAAFLAREVGARVTGIDAAKNLCQRSSHET